MKSPRPYPTILSLTKVRCNLHHFAIVIKRRYIYIIHCVFVANRVFVTERVGNAPFYVTIFKVLLARLNLKSYVSTSVAFVAAYT